MSEPNPALTGKRAEAAAQWGASEWREVAAFIGPNAERFEPVWAKSREQALAKGAPFAQGWCWPALFLGFAWYFYRKLWVMGAVLLVVPVVVGLFVPVRGVGIGVSVAATLLAKPLYVQHAVSRIAKIRGAGGGEREIAAAGGVSVAGLVAGIAILVLAVLSVFMVGVEDV